MPLTVRTRQGETLVSDGPFAETKDFVGGVVVIECANLDEAIAIAAGISVRALGQRQDPPGFLE